MDLAASLWDIGLGALTFLLVITVLVAVHELGHFLFARLFGMEVKAFAVMMGGIRKTNLTPHLQKPLLPGWGVGGVAAASLVLLGIGLATGNQPLEVAALCFLAIPIPIWIAWRLEQLYHLDPGASLRTLFFSYAGGLLLMMMGTRGMGINPPLLLGVLIASGLVGVLIVYYKPLSNKPDDSEMGHGQVEAASSGQTIPVLFRPLLWWTDRRGTEFSLLLLPLGGFAAIKGMHAREDGSEVNIPGGFYSKPAWQRFLVLFAGPFFSIAFGVLLLAGLFMTVGQESDVPTTRVGVVQQGSPADKAGLKAGDKILSINGVRTEDFFDLVLALRGQITEKGSARSGVATPVEFERNGQLQRLTITPRVSAAAKPLIDSEGKPTGKSAYQAELGISPQSEFKALPPGEALTEAVLAPAKMVTALTGLLSRPESAKDAIGGPITMAQVSTSAAKQGFHSVILMAAVLSITLGIMNLLPIPPLDGGQMVVAFIEMLRREKRLGIGLQQGLSMAGLLFVIGITLAAFAVDLGRQAEKNQNLPPASSSRSENSAPPGR